MSSRSTPPASRTSRRSRSTSWPTRRAQPFFLSVGFFETHREFFEPLRNEDAYTRPPANLPDLPETRRDMASFIASARSLDRGVGAVLDALERYDLARSTLVICTTDHGAAFPGAKATMSDRGVGVLLIMRGPGVFAGGKVIDALVSQIDLFPDHLRRCSGSTVPPGSRGCR